jgi:hypothetical protein
VCRLVLFILWLSKGATHGFTDSAIFTPNNSIKNSRSRGDSVWQVVRSARHPGTEGGRALPIAAFIKDLQDMESRETPLSAPTVKQNLAAPRMLFDWLVIVGMEMFLAPEKTVRQVTTFVDGEAPLW